MSSKIEPLSDDEFFDPIEYETPPSHVESSPISEAVIASSSKNGNNLYPPVQRKSTKELLLNSKAEDFVVKNLDTGEKCSIDDSEKVFGIPDSLNNLLKREDNIKHNPTTTNRTEVENKKKARGWFSSLIRRDSISESGSSLGTNVSAGSSNTNTPVVDNHIKVKVHNKETQIFSSLRLAQELNVHQDAIYTLKFSSSGQFLASGGKDGIVRVWVVINHNPLYQPKNNNSTSPSISETSPRPRSSSRTQQKTLDQCVAEFLESLNLSDNKATNDKLILAPTPFKEFTQHQADITDLVWSKHTEEFLYSASLDHTVRLWHLSREQALVCLDHPDFVYSICLHPRNDSLVLTACADKRLRLFSILDSERPRIVEWIQLFQHPGAVSYSPDDRMVVAGVSNGDCIFHTPEFKYLTKIECRNRKGKYKDGREVVGLDFAHSKPLLLITTHDSRIRLCDTKEGSHYEVLIKYKGHTNNSLPIRATFNEDDSLIICGSDDEHVYIWDTEIPPVGTGYTNMFFIPKKGRNASYEYFRAHHDTVVTVARFLPSNVLKRYSSSTQEYNEIKHIIITAGDNGEIRLFENRGLPKTL